MIRVLENRKINGHGLCSQESMIHCEDSCGNNKGCCYDQSKMEQVWTAGQATAESGAKTKSLPREGTQRILHESKSSGTRS